MDENSPLHRAFSQMLVDALGREVALRSENVALKDALDRLSPLAQTDPSAAEQPRAE